MLLIVIPAGWLAIAGIVVLLCRTAADGDKALALNSERGKPSRSFAGLTLFEDRATRAAHDERLGRGRAAAGRHPATNGTRGRRGSCIAN